MKFELLDDVPNEDNPYDDAWNGLCECGDGGTPSLEIDSSDVLISCSTCGKNLLHEDDLFFMEPIPIDIKCVQEHNHHWDTYGCDCDFYWELKTKVPKDD